MSIPTLIVHINTVHINTVYMNIVQINTVQIDIVQFNTVHVNIVHPSEKNISVRNKKQYIHIYYSSAIFKYIVLCSTTKSVLLVVSETHLLGEG